MTQRHKHADLIIAWANGAEMQVRDSSGGPWLSYESGENPSWSNDFEYRVKPEPKPDYKLIGKVLLYSDQSDKDPLNREWLVDCFCVFDGEANTLKSVEILK